MTVRQAAERLEVSQSTVYALVAAGLLACSRIGLGRGCIRISAEQLDEYRKQAEVVVPRPSCGSMRL